MGVGVFLQAARNPLLFPAVRSPPPGAGPAFLGLPANSKVRAGPPARGTVDLGVLPVLFYPVSPAIFEAAPLSRATPSRGFWTQADVPRVKLRGLSPADTRLVVAAVQDGLWDARLIRLGLLVPWTDGVSSAPRLLPREGEALRAAGDVALAQGAVTRELGEQRLRFGGGGVPAGGRPGGQLPAAVEVGPDVEAPAYPSGEVVPPSRNLLECPNAPLQPDVGYGDRGDLFLVEVKPSAGYVALGQSLAYCWNWNRFFGGEYPASPAILTDVPREYMRPICAAFGVSLFVLERLVVEAPAWAT